MKQIRRNLSQLSEISLENNPFESQPSGFTRYYVNLAEIFEGRLKMINGNQAPEIKAGQKKAAKGKDQEQENDYNGEDGGDDMSYNSDAGEGDNSKKVEVQYLIDNLEKSLKMPSQANKYLTDLKRIVQGLVLIEGNVFLESKDTLVDLEVNSAVQHL